MSSIPQQLTLAFEEPASLDEMLRVSLEFARSRFLLRRTPVIEWRSMPVTAGKALLQDSVICLSRELMTSPERVRDTLLHEYAHLVVFERYGNKAKPHGREWREVMQAFGLDAEVTHNYECEHRSMARKYRCTCEKCGEQFHRARPLKRNRIYHHVRCGGKIQAVKIA